MEIAFLIWVYTMNKIRVQDKLYKKAKVIVLEDENYSISYLQKNLEIGYNRARIVVELLESEKVITSPDKNGIRKIIKN